MTFRRRDFLKALGATIAAANLPPGSLDQFASKFSRIEAINFTNMEPEERVAKLRSFNDLLNEHLPYELLKEQLMKRNYIFENIEPESNYRGGMIAVPFKTK